MSNANTGSKFNGNLDIAAIAKRIRADVKASAALGGCTITVRSRRTTTCEAIDITIAGAQFSLAGTAERHSAETRAAIAELSAIAAAYNRTVNGEPHFYAHVSVDSTVLRMHAAALLIDA